MTPGIRIVLHFDHYPRFSPKLCEASCGLAQSCRMLKGKGSLAMSQEGNIWVC